MAVIALSVNSASSAWVDTGLVLAGGATLYACASGAWMQAGTAYEFPEGGYADASNPTPPYDPAQALTVPAPGPGWACSNCRPFSLVLAIRPDGGIPPLSPVIDGLQTNRASVFPGVGPGRVWAIVNDDMAIYGDNVGALSLKVGNEPVGCGGTAKQGFTNDVAMGGMVIG